MEREMSTKFKQEAEERFRCLVEGCTKLFKSDDFVRKHIGKRHPEVEAEARTKIATLMKEAAEYLRNTVTDLPVVQSDMTSFDNLAPFTMADADMGNWAPYDFNAKKTGGGVMSHSKYNGEAPGRFRLESRPQNDNFGRAPPPRPRFYRDLDAVKDDTPAELDY